MATQNYGDIARSMYDAFNRKDFDHIESICSDRLEWNDLASGQVFRGQNGCRQYNEDWSKAFPDGRIEVKNVVAAGDHVVVEFIGRGTQTGPMPKSFGRIQPTNRKLELSFCDVLRFRDGKIVSGNSYYDMASMLRQLGVLEMPKAA
jgi:steroid delta-isomerase-like uncharacterized protein